MTPRFAAVASTAARYALLAALLASPIARAESPTIYKWVDENGVSHYTTDKGRIPSEVRTRVERATPPVAAPPHPEDELRDAVRVKPKQPIAAPAAEPIPEPVTEQAAPAPSAAPTASPAPAPAPAPQVAKPAAPTPPVEAIAPPLAGDPAGEAEVDAVSAPPPARVAPLAPKQNAELAKIDGQIQQLESEIAAREEKLAGLISSGDEQRSTPLVDDPAFREISQRLPKLQAELQTLRERRNKIQPSATP